jgi:hypothetical protein
MEVQGVKEGREEMVPTEVQAVQAETVIQYSLSIQKVSIRVA